MESHYDTLGLAASASADDIKAAYRRLAQKHHPDKNRDDPARSAEMFTRVRQAYDTLMSPALRRQHDDELARHATFQAELARRRNAYANAQRGASHTDASGLYPDPRAQRAASGGANDPQSKPQPTDWHARAWDLVQRAPGVDALARALRSEGCLPSLASPLARDVAREYEQLKNATAQFQAGSERTANTSTDGHTGAHAYARTAGQGQSATGHGPYSDTASRAHANSGQGARESARNASRGASGASAASGASGASTASRTSGSAGQRQSGQQRSSSGSSQGPRAALGMPFGTPRQASTSNATSAARFGWVIVAAMVLILLWRYVPSGRGPGLRAMVSSSRTESGTGNRTESALEALRAGHSIDGSNTPQFGGARDRALTGPSQEGTIQRLIPGMTPRQDAAREDVDNDDAPVMPRDACAPGVDRIGCPTPGRSGTRPEFNPESGPDTHAGTNADTAN